MTPRQRELDTRQFKASNMRIKKLIEKERELLSDIRGEISLRFLQMKHKTALKKQRKNDKNIDK